MKCILLCCLSNNHSLYRNPSELLAGSCFQNLIESHVEIVIMTYWEYHVLDQNHYY